VIVDSGENRFNARVRLKFGEIYSELEARSRSTNAIRNKPKNLRHFQQVSMTAAIADSSAVCRITDDRALWTLVSCF
jgi:hypothetical protein